MFALVANLVLSPGAARRSTPPSQASTSARGVSKTAINVVFPVVAVNSLAGRLGFAEDKEFGEQTTAIHLYVNQINNGRRRSTGARSTR